MQLLSSAAIKSQDHTDCPSYSLQVLGPTASTCYGCLVAESTHDWPPPSLPETKPRDLHPRLLVVLVYLQD